MDECVRVASGVRAPADLTCNESGRATKSERDDGMQVGVGHGFFPLYDFQTITPLNITSAFQFFQFHLKCSITVYSI